jgi:hypothetical protein
MNTDDTDRKNYLLFVSLSVADSFLAHADHYRFRSMQSI